MRMYCLLVLAACLSASQATIKCQKCESLQGGDCNSGTCEGAWCTAQILENKATGTRQIKKDCTASNPTGNKDDGCIEDPTPPDGTKSYRCACSSGDFCNSESNVVRMQAMLNNRFIVGGGASGIGGTGSSGPFAGGPNSQPGSPNQQPGGFGEQQPSPGNSNQFPPSSPNGPSPNGSFTDRISDGQQPLPGGIGGQPQPGPRPTDLGSQQQPGSPNQFGNVGSPNGGQPPLVSGSGNPQAGSGQQFPSPNGNNPQLPPSQSGGGSTFPQGGGANPQLPPQAGNNPNSPFSPQGGGAQPGVGFNPQGQPGGSQGGSFNPQNPQGVGFNSQGAGQNPQNPQLGSNPQFPSGGPSGPVGGNVGHSSTDTTVTGARPNANGQPDLGSNDPNRNTVIDSHSNPAFGANNSVRTAGNQPSPNDVRNNAGGVQPSNSNPSAASLTCSCNEPSCNGPCKGAVCYRVTFPANSVHSQAFAGKRGDAEQLGCTDDTNVLIGGGNSLQRQIKDYRFRVNGQEVVVPVAQGFYCRSADYCNGAGLQSLATSILAIAAALALIVQRF